MSGLRSLKWAVIAGAGAMMTAGASAQLLPPVGDILEEIGRIGTDSLDTAQDTVETTERQASRLLRERLSRLRRHVRHHREALEMGADGPVIRGQVIATDISAHGLARVRRAGFSILAEEIVDGLGLRYVTLGVPAGLSVDEALQRLTTIDPDGDYAANHIHFTAGPALSAIGTTTLATSRADSGRTAVGIIDGGVAHHDSLTGGVEQRGFVRGAPRASAHGTAVSSLVAGRGEITGAAPGVSLLVADIYGDDPAGGSATAIVRAIGWMAARRTPVVTISLVGPRNRLVERAIATARARGIQFVAPVGNDGPAAPPAYPASYEGVIAVTGVDRRRRVLAEAGRARHLDYAAPGADMRAAAHRGGTRRVRGTSFAAPLVAGRLAALGSRRRLDAEAVDLGEPGPDARYGRGLICENCRN